MSEIGDEMDVFHHIGLVARAEDQLSAVIRSHLLVENLLDELMNAKTVEGDWSDKVLGGAPFGYMDKVKISVSFGLLDGDLWEPLKALGELRNKFAHKISYFISEEEQKKFLNAIPSKYHRQAYNFLSEEESEDEQPEEEQTNVVRLQGLKGQRAMSPQFLKGLWVLLAVLAQIHDNVSIDPTDPPKERV